MRPVSVSIEVPTPRDRIFDYLDVLGNHKRFTDHFLRDWTLSGPARGVGAKATMQVKKPGAPDLLEMEVVCSERPRVSVEESVSAGGRRVTRGTYELRNLADGRGTEITFTLTWLQAPLVERAIGPLVRGVTRRANAKSLRRLAEHLASEESKQR